MPLKIKQRLGNNKFLKAVKYENEHIEHDEETAELDCVTYNTFQKVDYSIEEAHEFIEKNYSDLPAVNTPVRRYHNSNACNYFPRNSITISKSFHGCASNIEDYDLADSEESSSSFETVDNLVIVTKSALKQPGNSKQPTKSVSFDSHAYVSWAYTQTEYKRKNSFRPLLEVSGEQLRNELDFYKEYEMKVHPDSAQYTLIYRLNVKKRTEYERKKAIFFEKQAEETESYRFRLMEYVKDLFAGKIQNEELYRHLLQVQTQQSHSDRLADNLDMFPVEIVFVPGPESYGCENYNECYYAHVVNCVDNCGEDVIEKVEEVNLEQNQKEEEEEVTGVAGDDDDDDDHYEDGFEYDDDNGYVDVGMDDEDDDLVVESDVHIKRRYRSYVIPKHYEDDRIGGKNKSSKVKSNITTTTTTTDSVTNTNTNTISSQLDRKISPFHHHYTNSKVENFSNNIQVRIDCR